MISWFFSKCFVNVARDVLHNHQLTAIIAQANHLKEEQSH